MNDYNFCKLGFADIDQILMIEEKVYSHPWTRGNFLDSFYSGHEACGVRNKSEDLMGYFVLMSVVDEMHLLNFSIAAERQRQGLARILLDKMSERAREKNISSILLEVRVSNQRAVEVYQRYGFIEIGRRKGYYPSADGVREDAIVMRIEL
ncbi:MAG: ribosomal protein S18-alanine N-acetyltransferase [Pseudomonadota bacterium]